jgi:hypothetical protein
MRTENVFYVYIIFDCFGIPRYVGKGTGNRIFCKPERRNNPRLRGLYLQQGSDLPAVIVRDGLREVDAFTTESALICAIGRMDLGTGSLFNLTDGGEGFSGGKHSESAKEYMRQTYKPPSQRGVKQSQETIEKRRKKLIGKKRPVDAIERTRAAHIGRARSAETRFKQSLAKLGKKQAPEFIEKRVVPLRGRKRPPEVGAKISAAKTGKTWPDERKAILKAANRSGEPEVRENIRQGTIASYAARGYQPIDPVKAAQLYESGKTLAQVAEALDVKPGRLYKALCDADVKMRSPSVKGRKRGRLPPESLAKMRATKLQMRDQTAETTRQSWAKRREKYGPSGRVARSNHAE